MEIFFDILKQLIRVPSVIGAEHPFFLTIKRELEEMGIEVSYYDGLLVASGKAPHSGYLSAHSDRHGLICSGPNEFQYAAYFSKNRADLIGNSISEQTYKDLVDRFCSQTVQAYEPWSGAYMGLGMIERAYICDRRKNMIFEIKGLEHLLPGTPIAFMDKLTIKDDFVSAQIDNVISVAMLIYLYHLGYQGTAFFSASEEAGKSWRFLSEWFIMQNIQTDKLLVLDTSPFPNINIMSKQDIVLRRKDANAKYKSPLNKEIVKICKKKGIKYTYKDKYIEEINEKLKEENRPTMSYGSTELGRLIKSTDGQIQGATLQIPTINYHTVNETASLKSINAMVTILSDIYVRECF